MADTARNDPEVVARLAQDLQRYLREADTADAAVESAVQRVEARIIQETSRRRGVMDAARRAYEQCCGNPDADCSPLQRALDRATDAWAAALRAHRMFNEAGAEFEPGSVRFKRVRHELVTETNRLLGAIRRDLDQYNRGSAAIARDLGGAAIAVAADGRAAAVSGLGSTAVASAVTAGPGFPPGYAMVNLSSVDLSDSTVTGPESFTKPDVSPADLEWAFNAFEEVVRPALRRGKGLDYFRERDQNEGGRFGARSYADTYVGFFDNNNAVVLERRPDGTFGVANGYHRIWVAQRMGLTDIPALVIRG